MASSPTLLTTLLILSAALAFLAPSSFADYVMLAGDTLNGGQSLSYGNYVFTMQTDCNLVLYDSSQAVWSSGTNNKGTGCNLRMQKDGNLVIYNGSNSAIWASNTARGQSNYVLVLQRDRNVVIYGPAIWATGSNRAGTAAVVISGNSTKSAVVAGDEFGKVTGK
ncbi:mannose-specific lectin-like [Carex rostrata]